MTAIRATTDLGNRYSQHGAQGQNGEVARYVCPYCRPKPLSMLRRPDGIWICARCGDPLQRVTSRHPLPAVAALLLALGVGSSLLAARRLPPMPPATGLEELLAQPPELLASLSSAGGLEGIDVSSLLRQLGVADAAWTPRVEVLPDGRTRYHYQRRSGEPRLSLNEIRQRIAAPPSFHEEQASIRRLVAVLGQAGVRIQIVQPRKPGAAAEWDPRARTLRIKPRVVASGSKEFAQVLNHEAIHVAQSCSRGHVRAMPKPLGLSMVLPPSLSGVLNEPVYRNASLHVQRLEREAYAHQHRPGFGAQLVERHCRLRSAGA